MAGLYSEGGGVCLLKGSEEIPPLENFEEESKEKRKKDGRGGWTHLLGEFCGH